jgi:hypothetical protein
MASVAIERSILAWRAAFRAHVAHLNTCAVCAPWDPNVEGAVSPCPKSARLLARRLAMRQQMTRAARALGFTSATAYQRAHGKVGWERDR